MDYPTVYADRNFRGDTADYDVGNWSMGDAYWQSIQVPAGYVAQLFQNEDSGGGYGLSADFLEDCTDLGPLDLRGFKYLSVFLVLQSSQPTPLFWRRGAYQAGEYVPGHWERVPASGALPGTSVVAVSPPIPMHTGGEQNVPSPVIDVRDHRFPPGVIEVQAEGQYAQNAESLFTVSLRGPDNPTLDYSTGRFNAALTCNFSDVPVGTYWVS
jgi:hypothetical protein